VEVTEETQLRLPLVVRLLGTNVEEGKKILAKLGGMIHTIDSFEDAAAKAVQLSKW